MQELEKILEEIKLEKKRISLSRDCSNEYGVSVISMLEKIEKIIRKHMNDGWIPVEKELPEEGQEVWVSAKTECVRRGTYTKSFGDRRLEGFICSDGFMWMNTANAWKPYVVPEPYSPERNEK